MQRLRSQIPSTWYLRLSPGLHRIYSIRSLLELMRLLLACLRKIVKKYHLEINLSLELRCKGAKVHVDVTRLMNLYCYYSLCYIGVIAAKFVLLRYEANLNYTQVPLIRFCPIFRRGTIPRPDNILTIWYSSRWSQVVFHVAFNFVLCVTGFMVPYFRIWIHVTFPVGEDKSVALWSFLRAENSTFYSTSRRGHCTIESVPDASALLL